MESNENPQNNKEKFFILVYDMPKCVCVFVCVGVCKAHEFINAKNKFMAAKFVSIFDIAYVCMIILCRSF